MGPTLSPETSAFKLQTPGKFPEEYKLHSEHGESLKTTIEDKICIIKTCVDKQFTEKRGRLFVFVQFEKTSDYNNMEAFGLQLEK